MEAAIHSTARNFGRIFERQMLWVGSLDELLEPAEAHLRLAST
jgi:lipoyl(octanoyl) transferase